MNRRKNEGRMEKGVDGGKGEKERGLSALRLWTCLQVLAVVRHGAT